MEVTRTFDLLERYSQLFVKPDILAGKKDGEWIKYSSNDYIEYAMNFACGLLSLGFCKGIIS